MKKPAPPPAAPPIVERQATQFANYNATAGSGTASKAGPSAPAGGGSAAPATALDPGAGKPSGGTQAASGAAGQVVSAILGMKKGLGGG